MSVVVRRPEPGRSRVPQWVGRLGRSGVPEATFALLALLYNEVLAKSPDRTPTESFLDFAACFFAGLSGRWPRVGTLGMGTVLLLMKTLETGHTSSTVFALFIPLVSNGANGRAVLRDLAALMYLILAASLTTPLSADKIGDSFSGIIFWAIMIGLAWAAGRTIHRLRQESEDQVKLRAEALRSQRRSIARDLHDTVSYATTTMIMRAEQIKLRTAEDPELVKDLDFIIATGRRSVRDLRGMMETLRRNDPDLDLNLDSDFTWRLPMVSEVIRERQAELASHGLTLQVGCETDLDSLPSSVRETLAKLIVEATSNMVKHAGRGPCQLIIETHENTLEAVFTNRLHQGASNGSGSGTGLGIVGASERVRALGGELEATVASGAWILRAQLPIGE